jgi:predicted extracellular nuclease
MKKILLSLAITASAFSMNAQTFCTELFFSEYVEGTGNNKALEIYNPTQGPIALSNYRIVRCSNGSTVGTDSLALTGTIGALDVWVVANGQTTSQPNSPACDTALQALADQLGGAYPDPLYMNGNDAILLVRVSPYAIVDIFGKIGEDPGTAWTDVFPYTGSSGTWITSNHTLQRHSNVTGGVTTNPTAFNVMAEYDSLLNNTWTGLGTHTNVCSNVSVQETGNVQSFSVYPNPSNGQFTISSTENINRVEVYNTLGELVFADFTSGASSKNIDLTDMPGGIYMVQVQLSNGELMTTRITKR